MGAYRAPIVVVKLLVDWEFSPVMLVILPLGGVKFTLSSGNFTLLAGIIPSKASKITKYCGRITSRCGKFLPIMGRNYLFTGVLLPYSGNISPGREIFTCIVVILPTMGLISYCNGKFSPLWGQFTTNSCNISLLWGNIS